MPTFEEINAIVLLEWDMVYTRWLGVEFGSSGWLVMLASIVVAYALLVKYVDKSRLREIILYGSLLAVIFGYIDLMGTMAGLWAYQTHFMPFIPSLFPLSYTLHPIGHMFTYQLTYTWRSFLVWNTAATAFFAFIAQPFYVWSGVLALLKWNYFLSFLIGITASTFARAVVIWLGNIELSHARQSKRAAMMPKLQPAMKLLDKTDSED